MVRTIDGDIIVADDGGEVIEQDDTDDDGVEILPDGGTLLDKPEHSPERIASEIVASEVGDDVVVWCGHGGHADHTDRTIYDGEVASTGYTEHADKTGGTHVVAIDVAGTRVTVHFDRVVDTKFDGNLSTPHAILFDPEDGARLPVTRFEGTDG